MNAMAARLATFARPVLQVTSPRLSRTATSSFGNASGQRKARSAIYCAVHAPMPGNSVKRPPL